MATINLLIAVDASTLAEAVADKTLPAGTPNAPTPLGPYSTSGIALCMMTEDSIMSNMAEDDFNVNVNSGDTLQWEMTAFSNSDHTVYPYNAVFNPPAAMSQMKYIAAESTVYFPAANHPTGPITAFKEHDYCAQSTVLKTFLSVQYALAFALVDNSSGKIIGYFSIDAFIIAS